MWARWWAKMERGSYILYSLNLKYWLWFFWILGILKIILTWNKWYETRCLWATANASLTCAISQIPDGSLPLVSVSPSCASCLSLGIYQLLDQALVPFQFDRIVANTREHSICLQLNAQISFRGCLCDHIKVNYTKISEQEQHPIEVTWRQKHGAAEGL